MLWSERASAFAELHLVCFASVSNFLFPSTRGVSFQAWIWGIISFVHVPNFLFFFRLSPSSVGLTSTWDFLIFILDLHFNDIDLCAGRGANRRSYL